MQLVNVNLWKTSQHLNASLAGCKDIGTECVIRPDTKAGDHSSGESLSAWMMSSLIATIHAVGVEVLT